MYAIVDVDCAQRSGQAVLEVAEAVFAAQPPIVQLRAKQGPAGEVLALLRALRQRCPPKTLLFANDRPDLATLAGCDGVHVGQEDLPLEAVRQFDPRLRVGISTHDLEQLTRALAQRPDYVAFGPVFETASKERPDPVVGIAGLRLASERARAAGIPLVAIGGITLQRAPQVRPHADLAAVIGALHSAGGRSAITEQARALQRALGDR